MNKQINKQTNKQKTCLDDHMDEKPEGFFVCLFYHWQTKWQKIKAVIVKRQ